MNQSQELQGATATQFPSQVSCDQNFDQHNSNSISEAPLEDGSHVSSKKIRLESIKIVQNLIERCMQLYMSKEEVLKFLSETLGIGHGLTTLVWQKLEEENADFFQVYNTRLRLKKQIQCFNDLLEKQYSLMRVNCLPVGYPALQQPAIPSMGYRGNISGCHVVNGIPEMSNLQTLGNNFVPCSNMVTNTTLKPMTMTPAGPFHFTAQTPLVQNINNPAHNSIFGPDMAATEELPLEPDGGAEIYSFHSFYPVTWDSGFTDPNFEGAEEFFADGASDSVTRKEDDSQE